MWSITKFTRRSHTFLVHAKSNFVQAHKNTSFPVPIHKTHKYAKMIFKWMFFYSVHTESTSRKSFIHVSKTLLSPSRFVPKPNWLETLYRKLVHRSRVWKSEKRVQFLTLGKWQMEGHTSALNHKHLSFFTLSKTPKNSVLRGYRTYSSVAAIHRYVN